jgi:hypothetical protein
MAVKTVLHFDGIDIVATRDDHILFVVYQIDIALLVHITHIAGFPEPAGREIFARQLRILVVALDGIGPPDSDFTTLTGRHQLSVYIADDHFLAGHGTSHR